MIRYTQNGKHRGFSLLELLLVIGIIAALAGLAVPYYQDYVGQSKDSVMRANLHSLKKVLMEYKADTGSYPAMLNHLVSPPPPPEPPRRQYLFELPADPAHPEIPNWGYSQVNNGASFTLHSIYLNLL